MGMSICTLTLLWTDGSHANVSIFTYACIWTDGSHASEAPKHVMDLISPTWECSSNFKKS